MSLVQTLGSAVNGGAEAYFLSLVGALHRAGYVQCAAIRAHPARLATLKRMGVPAHELPFRKTFDFSTSPAIAKLARDHKARIVIAWMNRAASLTPAGPWKRIGRLGGYYKLKNYRNYDALVGNTQDIVDWMVREGWPAERAHYIPNFAASGVGDKIDRAAFDTPEGAPLLLGMGRLHASKAHDVSLKALRLLPEAFLWIAGDGPEEAALKALAHDLGVAERVRFLGWRDDAPSLYRTADICIFPSRFEPLGNVVIQAWAHNIPIIAAKSTGPAALIKDGADGLLVNIDDHEALAEKTRLLLSDAGLRESLAQAGGTRVAGSFSETAGVAQWRELFDSLGGV